MQSRKLCVVVLFNVSDAMKFSTFNSLVNIRDQLIRDHLKIALSTISKLPVLNFYRLMLLPFCSESKNFSLFLAQVDKMSFGTPYLAATSLLLILFSSL